MAKNLKIKSSPMLIIARFLKFLLTISSIACLFFGFVDIRTEEQKLADERKALISTTAFRYSVEAVQYAKTNSLFDVEVIESVSYLPTQNKYVLVVYKTSLGMENAMTYSAKTKKGYNGRSLFSQEASSLISNDTYLGRPSTVKVTEYTGEELKILLQEAGYGSNNL